MEFSLVCREYLWIRFAELSILFHFDSTDTADYHRQLPIIGHSLAILG